LPDDAPALKRQPFPPRDFHCVGHSWPRNGSSPPAPHFPEAT
jgi:hypothetical protein